MSKGNEYKYPGPFRTPRKVPIIKSPERINIVPTGSIIKDNDNLNVIDLTKDDTQDTESYSDSGSMDASGHTSTQTAGPGSNTSSDDDFDNDGVMMDIEPSYKLCKNCNKKIYY